MKSIAAPVLAELESAGAPAVVELEIVVMPVSFSTEDILYLPAETETMIKVDCKLSHSVRRSLKPFDPFNLASVPDLEVGVAACFD